MLWGWARDVTKKVKQSIVVYRSPCGRRLRNMDEVHRYLRLTGSHLGVDLFSFDSCVQCFKEFKPKVIRSAINGNPTLRCFKQISVYYLCSSLDITKGKENVRVSSVNSIDCTDPEFVEVYTRWCLPTDFEINTELEFLVCCDCTDDCQDKTKCQCWQLTIQVRYQFSNNNL